MEKAAQADALVGTNHAPVGKSHTGTLRAKRLAVRSAILSDDARINASMKLTLFALLDCIPKSAGELHAWPSLATITNLTGLKERATRDALTKLVSLKVLTVMGRSRWKTNSYRINANVLSRMVSNGPGFQYFANVRSGLLRTVPEGMTPSERLVWVSIRANADGMRLTRGRIASLSRMTPRGVSKVMAALEGRELLTRSHRTEKGGYLEISLHSELVKPEPKGWNQTPLRVEPDAGEGWNEVPPKYKIEKKEDTRGGARAEPDPQPDPQSDPVRQQKELLPQHSFPPADRRHSRSDNITQLHPQNHLLRKQQGEPDHSEPMPELDGTFAIDIVRGRIHRLKTAVRNLYNALFMAQAALNGCAWDMPLLEAARNLDEAIGDPQLPLNIAKQYQYDAGYLSAMLETKGAVA